MAEIHIIGQIKSAKDFPRQGLFCKWNLQYGKNMFHDQMITNLKLNDDLQ